ncbi:MAG: alpha/beta hydrolase [Beijerinckiaceae bacterium]
MASIDYEAEYDNRARTPSFPTILARWGHDAMAFRAKAKAKSEEEVAYGATPREVMDVFFPKATDGAPLFMFIHGGYWRAFDQRLFSHFARGLTMRGGIVAIPTYGLCPEVTIATILDQMRRACVFLWKRFQRPLTIIGHSAGGQLAAALMATDWKTISPHLPADLVKASMPISGLPDLLPLIQTSINQDLRLDEDEAKRLSPLHWPAPANGLAVVVVGETESGEYRRQTRELVAHWRAGGLEVAERVVSGANHFTVLAELVQPDSRMTNDAWRLATE